MYHNAPSRHYHEVRLGGLWEFRCGDEVLKESQILVLVWRILLTHHLHFVTRCI
jgi:hypothetical protein